MSSEKQQHIKQHLIRANPGLERYMGDYLAPILEPRLESIPEAVTNLVVKQMLSQKAADTILGRLHEQRRNQGLKHIAELDAGTIREQGVSNRKTRTIKEFYEASRKNDGMEHWRRLDTKELLGEVNQHWGLSDWTASMLAIFYFAHEDVFPRKDVSITNAVEQLREQDVDINPERSKPYRSYLSLYLYHILDAGFMD